MTLAIALVTIRIALPLLLIDPAWEFHRDELLYFAMGDHLEWLRMQFPPLIAVVAHVGRALFDDSVLAARVPAALAGAALLATMLWFARRLGAGAWALVVIAAASVAAPVFLRTSVLMHPVVFDQLWATLAIAALALAAVEEQPRWWLLIGIAFGLGALTKFSVAFYVLSAAVAVVFTPALRQQFATRWPWLALLVAMVLAIPSVAGQITNGWPFLLQMQSLRGSQLATVSFLDFLSEQPRMLGGAALLLPLGLAAAARRDRAAGVTGIILVTLLGLMILLHGKGYYAAPGYPAFLVAGVVWFERRLSARDAVTSRRIVRVVLPLLVAGIAALLLPFGIPLLTPTAMARYAVTTGTGTAVQTNRDDVRSLPQDYADMLGWRAMADAAARAFHALSPDEQRTVILAGSNYGQAGALAMYRQRLRLPYPVSVHGDFHAWGTYGRSGEVVILVDRPDALEGLRAVFGDVRQVERLQNPRAVPEEQDVRIYLARGPRVSINSLWPTIGPRWD